MPSISDANLEILQTLSDILHLFHHRNNNQHRRSIWWRHFSIFRRQLNSLLNELNHLHETPTSHIARLKKKALDEQLREKIDRRLSLWRDMLVPKWHRAFSQLCADGRFAMLGIVLMAAFSQACYVVGVTAAIDDLVQVEVESVLDRFAKEKWVEESPQRIEVMDRSEDVGEVVKRDMSPAVVRETANSPEPLPMKGAEAEQDASNRSKTRCKRETSTHKPIKADKKRRRKGNAIDDLFDGID